MSTEPNPELEGDSGGRWSSAAPQPHETPVPPEQPDPDGPSGPPNPPISAGPSEREEGDLETLAPIGAASHPWPAPAGGAWGPPAGAPPASPPTDAEPSPVDGIPASRARSGRFLPMVVAAIIGAIIGGGVVAASVDGRTTVVRYEAPQAGTNQRLAEPAVDIQDLLARVEPAVVSISVQGDVLQGAGTGMVLTADGEILTNAHVVDGATSIEVQLIGEPQPRPAELVGSDSFVDLALIRVRDVENLPTVRLGDSSRLHVGDSVVAIGNALALLGGPTVTTGIVSATDRSIDEIGDGLIQTDAAINQGNSGGPLVDARGEVIGINTAVIRGAAGAAAEGIGLAIPVNAAKDVLSDLRAGGRAPASTAFLGVNVATLTPGLRIETPATSGAVVSRVEPGTAADAAGLQRTDVVVRFGDREIRTATALIIAVRQHSPGERVEVEYFRGDDRRTAVVTLTSRADAADQ